jgi:zinc/manganese transport system substrate-binding protein
MSRNHALFAVVAAALVGVAAPRIAHADLKIAATVPDLAALAQEIGGGHVKVRALSLHTQDPHFVDAKPSLALVVNKADLLLAVGLGLEVGWLPTLQNSARNPKVRRGAAGYLDCSQFVQLRDKRATADRSAGDIHPGGNPHYLYDPRAAAACADGIAAKMAALDPGNAAAYRRNLAAFKKRLAKRVTAWEKRLAPHRGAPIVTYHRSWVYLTGWLGLTEVAYLEPKPGVRPSPRHIAQVIRLARQRKVKLVLQEVYYPDRTGRLVSGKIGARLVQVSAGADVGKGQGYIARMDAVIDALAAALGE